jgi:hypothetical protein
MIAAITPAFLMLAFALAASSQGPATREAAPIPPLSSGVVIQVTAEQTGDGRAIISGRTNLPEGTELMSSLKKAGDVGEAQAKGAVTAGRFRSESLGPPAGLSAGRYTASVTMPYTKFQPPQVLLVAGENGQNLRGPLVKRNTVFGATATAVSSLVVRPSGGAPQARPAASETRQLRRLHEEMTSLVELGRGMQPLRADRSDLEKSRVCGKLMRERQARARALAASARGLSHPLARRLSSAEGSLELCTSYLRNARISCDDAQAILKEVGAAIGR